MREAVVVACAVGLITCVAACGGTAAGTPTPSKTVSPTPTPSASPSSAPTLASTLALVVSDLPAGGPSLSQISDGLLNGVANTDQRVFANSDNTYRLEDDIIPDSSPDAAESDYATIRNAAQSNVATLSSHVSPGGIGSQADEYIGKDASGRSIIAISFQEGSVIVACLEVASFGTVEQSFAESVAEAQDQKILDAGG
jgi:hypothetical protein